MKKGIDISYWQNGLKLQDAKDRGVEFVVIRAGCGKKIDSVFEKYVKEAIEVGLPYGFYWYSEAFSTAEAMSEVEACLSTISGYKPVYPVYYDMEMDTQIEKLDKDTRTKIITTFCDRIKENGYTPGVYLNPAWLETYVDKKSLLEKYDLWLACWTDSPDVPPKYQYGQKMWQWGKDKISGKDVDGDICWFDYDRQPK